MSRWAELLVVLGVGGVLYLATAGKPDCPDGKCPAPPAPKKPAPAPAPAPKPPKKPRRPWAEASPAAVAAQSRGVFQQSGDPEPMVDALAMPDGLRKRNIAARGLGCCVFRSLDYASHWQNVPQLHGFPEWMVQSGIEGGGYPGKVDKLIPRISADRGLPVPEYIQYEGRDTAVIELALKTGRLPCITWQGNHMLNCPYLDNERGAILDNNDPGRVHFYSREQWERKYQQGGGGWCVVLLNPGPTPPPRQAADVSGLVFGNLLAGPRYHYPHREPLPVADPMPPGFRWEHHPEWEQLALMGPGGQVGTYRLDSGLYFRKIGRGNGRGDWESEPSEPPCPVPGWALPGVRGWQPGKECYRVNGRVVSKRDALAALADDSQLPYITIIGPQAEREQVLRDLDSAPELAPYRGKYRVQSYDPSEWAVAASWGFVTSGLPTVYVQAADGRVLHRQDDYQGGGSALSKALRRADPNYKPQSDPHLGKPGLPGLPGPLQDLPLPAVAVAVSGVLVLLRKGAPANVA